jgi:hypothetical protein
VVPQAEANLNTTDEILLDCRLKSLEKFMRKLLGKLAGSTSQNDHAAPYDFLANRSGLLHQRLPTLDTFEVAGQPD